MPLDRAHTTRASRIMLPTHAVLALGLGVSWLTAPIGPSAGLQAIAAVWPLRNTGIVLIVFGVVELVALLSGNRDVDAIALACGALVFTGLAVMSAFGHVTGTSWGGIMVWIYIAICHTASMVSLAFYEGTGARSR